MSADIVLEDFFSSPEYEGIREDARKNSSNLKDDLWLDDLALLDLTEFLERAVHVKVDSWDSIATIGDLKSRIGNAADRYVSLKKSTVSVKATAPKPVSETLGRSRIAVRVGAWQPTSEEWQKTLALVNPERREKVLKYKFESDQKLHLCGQLLLRRLVHLHLGVPYKNIEFAYTKGNKPVLAPLLQRGSSLPNYNFNYSHEGEFVVGASEPLSIVGVDVAKVEIRGRDRGIAEYFDTMKKCFSPQEWQAINAGRGDQTRLFRFYVFWALKESYVKATGWGLATEFSTFEFRNVFREEEGFDLEQNHSILVVVEGRVMHNWFFRIHLLDERHVMAVATGPSEDAAPTFKATFKLPLGDAAWRSNPPPASDCEKVVFLSVPQLIEGMPPF